ncbi:xaa-Pro aminopeptidase 1-like [Watersipora subatra]|uniref:xaa-Pro aminopeptidase 1-like n=1 Tax=Watersipora subatra TaxID=2589382 RepID=UPI00355C6955
MTPKITGNLLKSLRKLITNNKPLHAYIVPSGDAHQNEYIAACDCQREFITGFSGSAGTAVVTQKLAALWVDGRYHTQADNQTDDNWLVMKEGLKDVPSIPEWLSECLKEEGGQIGVDPNIMSFAAWERMSTGLMEKGLQLVPISGNLVDQVWIDRPARPNNPLMTLSTKYTGETWQEKVAKVRQEMIKMKSFACIFTALDDIAWLLNLRGSDIQMNPVFFSYVIVSQSEISLFVSEEKITSDVSAHLRDGTDAAVLIQPYHQFSSHLEEVIEKCPQDSKIWLSKSSSYKIHCKVPEEKRLSTENSHVRKMKAVKNCVEIEGMRDAHIKDAVSLCEFFSWLEMEIKHNNVTESAAATKLEELKRQQEDYVSLSFDTISSCGPNAAINHYKPVEGEDRVIESSDIYLLDSGAQYRNGTTDVTRTVHFGNPSSYQMECYTRVLKGHIQLARAIWPRGVKGNSLDSFARMHLWSAGLDYKHGTGHGVGAFLNVHEGPCAISYRSSAAEIALEPGMIITDEPGYYEDGSFGIRIENCMLVTEAATRYNFKNTGFLQMEPITLVPISTKLIEPSLLTADEIAWLNGYHTKCRETLEPLLKKTGKAEALKWLLRETVHIG